GRGRRSPPGRRRRSRGGGRREQRRRGRRSWQLLVSGFGAGLMTWPLHQEILRAALENATRGKATRQKWQRAAISDAVSGFAPDVPSRPDFWGRRGSFGAPSEGGHDTV